MTHTILLRGWQEEDGSACGREWVSLFHIKGSPIEDTREWELLPDS